MRILVLEASTTSAKAMVFDTRAGTSLVQTEPYPGHGVDPTLHDADGVVAALTSLGRRVAQGPPISAIALVGAWHGLFVADPEVRPITPVYLWSNTASADACSHLRADHGFVDWFYQASGCMVNATYPVFAVPLLRQRGVLGDDRLILDEGSYLNWVLTGQLVQTPCLASGTGWLNTHSRRYDAEVLAWAGIDEAQLPHLVPSQVTYPLSARGASLLGLPEGTPVIPTIADGAANQVGAGALTPGVMTVSVGTSAALRVATSSPRLPRTPSTWCYVSTHGWLSGAATSGGCNCVDWFRTSVGGGLPYAELEPESLGPHDPVFLPFLHGERCPGWDDGRRGQFVGLGSHDNLKTMYGAVQEGVLFNLLQCYEALAELNGNPKRIKLSGGILHSPRWTQMCADIFGATLELSAVLQASLMGGAMCAMEVMGVIANAADHESPPSRLAIPNLEAHDRHRQRYRAYLRAYAP